MNRTHILTLACPDRFGIVAQVTGLLADQGGNITDAQQYNDPQTLHFFMRVVFDLENRQAFETAFAELAKTFEMQWSIREESRAKRVLILVSKFDHCLVDLLYRQRVGDLDMEIVGIISNHPQDALTVRNLGDLPYHHLPVTRDMKAEQEQQIAAIIADTDAELVILARYMQILSDEFSRKLAGRCVNIHHSFLPGFKGARPYHQAHKRGVKIIGATAHFVTPDLDEGPIIAQDVERITHRDSADALVAKGRAIEQRVLARAVRLLIEDRVFANGARTVVFD